MTKYTDFEYTVSPRRNSTTTPLTVELTCTEVCRRKIIVSNALTTTSKSLVLPHTSTVRHSGFIPLEKSNNVSVEIARGPKGTTVIPRPSKLANNYSLNWATVIWQVVSVFGVTKYGCDIILGEIETTITSLSSLGEETGVIEVKIWKIITNVCRIYRYLKTEEYLSYATSEEENKEECVICMEEFKQRELVSTLACNHRFHRCCIFEWTKRSLQCPLCRNQFLFLRH